MDFGKHYELLDPLWIGSLASPWVGYIRTSAGLRWIFQNAAKWLYLSVYVLRPGQHCWVCGSNKMARWHFYLMVLFIKLAVYNSASTRSQQCRVCQTPIQNPRVPWLHWLKNTTNYLFGSNFRKFTPGLQKYSFVAGPSIQACIGDCGFNLWSMFTIWFWFELFIFYALL